VSRQKRKEVEASVPARIQSPGSSARTSCFQLQKSVGDDWPRISSANALQKERQGRVNGGLARGEGRRVKPSASTSRERLVAGRTHRFLTARTGTRPRVVRECHSAVTTSPKAVPWSWDRGCNDHRILRRVPTEGRHPGSSRSVSVTRSIHGWSRRYRASSDPCTKVKSQGHGQEMQFSRRRERREDGRAGRDRDVRGSTDISIVGEKRPRS